MDADWTAASILNTVGFSMDSITLFSRHLNGLNADDGKLVIGLRGSNRFECAKFVHSRQHRMGIADEHCQHVGILSRERGSVEIRSTDSVLTECEGCTTSATRGCVAWCSRG